MKKVVFRSFLVVLLLLGIFHNKAMAAESTTQSEMTVISINLPVYRNFEELSDFRIHLGSDYKRYAVLSFKDKVTILSVKDYAAQIRMADGRTGWVHKDYLSSNIMNQTWLVKEGRNLREDPSTTKPSIGSVPDKAKVYVLDYDKQSKFYKIQTTDGHEGWIKGTYQEGEGSNFIDYGKGLNVIPYEFDKEGKVTTNLSIFTPLNTVAKVTANQINKFIEYKTNGATTEMAAMGSAYLEAQTSAHLNAVYLLAHSGLETKWGTSDIVKNVHNYYGIGAYDSQPAEGADTFSSKSTGIIEGAKFISTRYVNRTTGFQYPFPQPTLDNMRFNDELHQYSTDEAWAGKISTIIKEFNIFTYTKGWKNIAEKWYYNNGDGTYKTGWLLDKNKWYFLDTSSGVMLTGWKQINGKWYYLNPDGDMKTGWLYSGGKWYYLDFKNGDMKTGWLYTGGKWYYLNNSGVMQTGWIKLSGKWYYLYKDGHMAANTTVGGYRLGKTGAML
ncbi:glucosaminidase domain-containing protein [Neobacillus sp. PS2-9]|uniref:glucosaminidase domain-containing protein n=1 Tax=Neobacillus sp. PS2-9 TaxID=3070676 RepID=UPI0027DFEA82|nr:glucosaminidase domain-containing protein [Neobacillus sp. PS2-9]WML59031.1 glucosaminidase domain-containing protein [Neobacillus sp. PS2-9]